MFSLSIFQIKQRQHTRRHHEFSREEVLEAEKRRKEEREALERRRQQEAEAPKEESIRPASFPVEKTTTTKPSRKASKSSSSGTRNAIAVRVSSAAATCKWSGATRTTRARRTIRSTRNEPKCIWPSERGTSYGETWKLEDRREWICVSSGKTTNTWSRCYRFAAKPYEAKLAGTHK